MSVLVIILIVIAALVALFFIAAALTPKDLQIEKTITINRPLPQTFDYVKFVRNHDNFNMWMMMDPDMKKSFRGTDGQPGFVYAWDSNKKKNVGAGEQEIKKIDENKSIDYELRFTRPMQDVANARFMFEPAGSNQTKVQWGFYSQMKFPMNAMKSVFRNMLGKNLESGLRNLKTVLEK